MYGLSFDHILVEDDGKRIYADKFVPITPEQAKKAALLTVKEIPQAKAGDFVYLEQWFTWLKCIGDNLWRHATDAEIEEQEQKARE